MKYYLILVTLLCVTVSFGQAKDFKISGTVVTDAEKTPLESATVYLERAKDSTLITYTITDKEGKFTLEGRTFFKDANLNISYVGKRKQLSLLSDLLIVA